jgi:hypothetical protein
MKKDKKSAPSAPKSAPSDLPSKDLVQEMLSRAARKETPSEKSKTWVDDVDWFGDKA